MFPCWDDASESILIISSCGDGKNDLKSVCTYVNLTLAYLMLQICRYRMYNHVSIRN